MSTRPASPSESSILPHPRVRWGAGREAAGCVVCEDAAPAMTALVAVLDAPDVEVCHTCAGRLFQGWAVRDRIVLAQARRRA